MKTIPFSVPRLMQWTFPFTPATPSCGLDFVYPASRRSFHPWVRTKARRLEPCNTVAAKIGADAGISAETWVKRLACLLALLFVISLAVSGAWGTMLIVDSLWRAQAKPQFQVFATHYECRAEFDASQNDSRVRE